MAADSIKQGDFSHLAADYAKYRSGYSDVVTDALLAFVGRKEKVASVADVGAGTGIWSKLLAARGLLCTAIEPNDAMRAQGEAYTEGSSVSWKKGSGEHTGLDSNSVPWVTMASSFHWTDPLLSLPEFHRLLQKNGHLTVLWNPRDVSESPLHQQIEARIREIVPGLKRVSSGATGNTLDWGRVLTSTGHFDSPLFIESSHEVTMSRERYLGAWRSVNDIQAQAGPERFREIMAAIEGLLESRVEISVPYRTRSWTVVRRA